MIVYLINKKIKTNKIYRLILKFNFKINEDMSRLKLKYL